MNSTEPDETATPGPGMRLKRHKDHDPSLICRPAGFGLCELAPDPRAVQDDDGQDRLEQAPAEDA